MDPHGKLIVVTGAAGGIGGALVRALRAGGAGHVVATDLATDGIPLDERVEPLVLDVADEAATFALVEDVTRRHGPIDVWFANAGVSRGGRFDAFHEIWSGDIWSEDAWRHQWDVNLMSHVYAVRALFPGWVARGSGHLVTTASMAGLLTSLGDGVYAATKHAAVGLAEWLAITHADRGIKVSCVCPGAVDTDMLRSGAGGDAARATAAIGGGEVLSPDRAATLILAALAEDRFLILTHPEMRELMTRKAQEPERWIGAMSRLWHRAKELLAG